MAVETEFSPQSDRTSYDPALRRRTPRRALAIACLVLVATGLTFHVFGPLQALMWKRKGTNFQHVMTRPYDANLVTKAPCNRTCRWLYEQSSRKHRVSSTCSSYRNTTRGRDLSYTLTPELQKTMTHFLVLDSYKLIYCYIPKVGCTNWKRVFLVLSGATKAVNETSQFQTHVRTSQHIPTLAKFTFEEAKKRLDTYTKFMFVRHPFERLISGYRDKFLKDYPSSTLFRKSYGPKIASYGRLGPGSPGHSGHLRPDGTRNVSFRQFVQYVGDPKNVFRGDDPTEHWNEMYRMCHPCMIKYDVLGNFSTLHEDAILLLRAKTLDRLVSYPISTNPTNSSDEEYMTNYFADISPSSINALLTRYGLDFEIFGYTVASSIQTILQKGQTPPEILP